MNVQKVLIDNGWTIENKRKLISKIGEPQYNQIKNAFDKYSTIWRSSIVPADKIKLNQDGDSLCLSLGLHNASNINFIDNDINIENIVKSLHTLLGEVFAPKKIDFSPSATMKKLFTPEFAPKRHIDENGYFVTTVINRKTGGPVEAFVKEGFVNPYENSAVLDNPFITREKWEIFVKDKDISNRYIRIGKRTFELDAYEYKIKPGYMESKEGNKQYDGIGVRLHQVAVERMLQEDFNTVEIDSLYSAFPFHYKCGFRTSPDYDMYVKEELMENINSWSNTLKIPVEDLKSRLILEEQQDCYVVDYKAIEELKKQICIKSDGIQNFEDTLMSLQGEHLREWIDLAESQPILLDYKKELF